MRRGQESGTPPESGEDDEPDEDEDDDQYDGYDPDEDENEDDEPDPKVAPLRRTAPAAVVPPAPKGNDMAESTELDGDAVLKAIQEGTADGVERVLLSRLVPIEKAITTQNERIADLIAVQNATGAGYAELIAENAELRKSIGQVTGELGLLKSLGSDLSKALGVDAGKSATKPGGKIDASKVLLKAGVAVPGEDDDEVDEATEANEKLVTKALRLQALGKTPDGLTQILSKGTKPTAEDFETLRKGVEAVR